MMHFSMRMRCDKCREVFAACVHAEGPLDPAARYVVHCPSHGGPFVLPAALFRPADSCPEGAVVGIEWRAPPPTPPAPPNTPRRPWWRFWAR